MTSSALTASAIPRDYNFAADILKRNLDAGRGGKIAFIDPRGKYSYAELAERVERFGHVLRSLGVRREERILICLLDGIDWPTAFLGAIKAGVVAVPVNTLMTEDDYRFMLEDSRARLLVVSEALYRQICRCDQRKRLPRARHRLRRRRAWLTCCLTICWPSQNGQNRSRHRGDDARRHVLLALHLRLDRQAEGRRAYSCRSQAHRRSLCGADSRHYRERHLLFGGEAVFRLRPRQRADLPDVGGRDDGACCRRGRRRKPSPIF